MDPPDLGRCLDELRPWVDHLRSATHNPPKEPPAEQRRFGTFKGYRHEVEPRRESPTEHVAQTFALLLGDQPRLRQLGVATEGREEQLLSACYIIEARHLCMMMRGVQKQNSLMVTSAMLGNFRDSSSTRNEFLQLVRHPTST